MMFSHPLRSGPRHSSAPAPFITRPSLPAPGGVSLRSAQCPPVCSSCSAAATLTLLRTFGAETRRVRRFPPLCYACSCDGEVMAPGLLRFPLRHDPGVRFSRQVGNAPSRDGLRPLRRARRSKALFSGTLARPLLPDNNHLVLT